MRGVDGSLEFPAYVGVGEVTRVDVDRGRFASLLLLIAFSIIGSSVVLGADLGREAREAPQNTRQCFPSDHYVGCSRYGDGVLLRAVTLGCCRPEELAGPVANTSLFSI